MKKKRFCILSLILLIPTLGLSTPSACPILNGTYECNTIGNNSQGTDLTIKTDEDENKIISYIIQQTFGIRNYKVNGSWNASNNQKDNFLYLTRCEKNNSIETNFLKPKSIDSNPNYSFEKMIIRKISNKKLELTTSSKNYVANEIFFSSHFLKCKKTNRLSQ